MMRTSRGEKMWGGWGEKSWEKWSGEIPRETLGEKF